MPARAGRSRADLESSPAKGRARPRSAKTHGDGALAAAPTVEAEVEAEAPNALQTLMRTRIEEKRWSYGDVARRGGMSKSTVHHLATLDQSTRMPQAGTLRSLARGLELPLDIVRRAAAQACGIYVYEPEVEPEVDVLIASLQQLSAQDRRHVAALVESLLRHSRQDDEDALGDEGDES